MNIEDLYRIYLQFPSIQTDTRKLKPGDLFFALKGGNFNGNQFAAQAVAEGAAFAIVDEPAVATSDKIILVENVLQTLQDLAKHHREQFAIPFIAITGSNGKTTTKELIHAVLSSTYTTYTTEGNLNNHIGIPLTILRVKPDAEIAVVEMGANHLKEIAGYCLYCKPTHGLITNIGKAHLEGFGSVEGVRKAKGELYDYLRDNKGTAFVLWDDDSLRDMSKGIPEIIRYGSVDGDVRGSISQNDPFLAIEITKGVAREKIQTQLVGDYNLPNILSAVAVGNYFNVSPEKIKRAIESYTPSNSRSQLVTRGSNHIILDAYNANPSSMTAAIENFARTRAENKILILGAMAELGKESIREHEKIISLIGRHPWKQVVLVGGDFVKLNPPVTVFENSLQAKDWFQKADFQDNYFLIKGSRSMQMEKLLEP